MTGDDYAVIGDESLLSQKAHGTTEEPVQEQLRWNVNWERADEICSFNDDHDKENRGYAWSDSVTWFSELESLSEGERMTFYDSVTGKPLFIAPQGRSLADFKKESRDHGWPSFRDEEVVWENVRVLNKGDTVSTTGTYLGHAYSKRFGNRYCINLSCISGRPENF